MKKRGERKQGRRNEPASEFERCLELFVGIELGKRRDGRRSVRKGEKDAPKETRRESRDETNQGYQTCQDSLLPS